MNRLRNLKISRRRGVGAVIGLLAALMALGVGGHGPLSPVFNQPVPVRANGGVVELDIQPIPEGPGLVFERRPPRAGTGGGNMVVILGNGKQVTYGPCYRPAAIKQLWAEIVAVQSPPPVRPLLPSPSGS